MALPVRMALLALREFYEANINDDVISDANEIIINQIDANLQNGERE